MNAGPRSSSAAKVVASLATEAGIDRHAGPVAQPRRGLAIGIHHQQADGFARQPGTRQRRLHFRRQGLGQRRERGQCNAQEARKRRADMRRLSRDAPAIMAGCPESDSLEPARLRYQHRNPARCRAARCGGLARATGAHGPGRRAGIGDADPRHPGPAGASRPGLGRPGRHRVRPRPGLFHRAAHRLLGRARAGIRQRRSGACRGHLAGRGRRRLPPRRRASRWWPCSMRAWTRSISPRTSAKPARWRQQGEFGLARPEAVTVAPGWSLAGNAFAAYGERLPPAAARIEAMPTAGALLRLAPALLAAGQGGPAAGAMPLYIRDKVAQTTQERAALRAAPPTRP